VKRTVGSTVRTDSPDCANGVTRPCELMHPTARRIHTAGPSRQDRCRPPGKCAADLEHDSSAGRASPPRQPLERARLSITLTFQEVAARPLLAIEPQLSRSRGEHRGGYPFPTSGLRSTLPHGAGAYFADRVRRSKRSLQSSTARSNRVRVSPGALGNDDHARSRRRRRPPAAREQRRYRVCPEGQEHASDSGDRVSTTPGGAEAPPWYHAIDFAA